MYEAAIQMLEERLNDLEAKLVQERTSMERHRDVANDYKSKIRDLRQAVATLNG